MENSVTMEELKKVLEDFEKAKSPGPIDWNVEFFLDFFNLLGKDFLVVVEESRLNGMVSDALNATFLNLIPKKDRPENFQYFRPISLCNVVYKMITKIIANRLKPVFSKFMSKGQFGFLENR